MFKIRIKIADRQWARVHFFYQDQDGQFYDAGTLAPPTANIDEIINVAKKAGWFIEPQGIALAWKSMMEEQ